MYIKLNEDMDLTITVNETLYRGDNLNRKIIYVLPKVIGEVDLSSAVVYLSYVRADGTPDIITLEQMDDLYANEFYQYTVPITCKMTKYPGEICTWVQIYSGTPSNPTIAKSGECMLYVRESKNMDEYLCDRHVTAMYQMKSEIDSIIGTEDIDNIDGGLLSGLDTATTL